MNSCYIATAAAAAARGNSRWAPPEGTAAASYASGTKFRWKTAITAIADIIADSSAICTRSDYYWYMSDWGAFIRAGSRASSVGSIRVTADRRAACGAPILVLEP